MKSYLSPAKVNLHLEVLEKRPDGFHEIQSLMHRVDLFDRIEIRLGGTGIRLVAEGEPIPGGTDNLVCRAAQIFSRETGVPVDAEIRLEKRIPVGAGLGGGSGNAATVLLALNDEFQAGMEAERLMLLGSRLGADVPFFIFQKPALARGKGEILTPVQMPARLWFLLLIPPFQISTAWAYAKYDGLAGRKAASALRDSYPEIGDLVPILKNDLEVPALREYPEIGRMKGELVRRGARGALMSGSGSVIFGLFADPEEARRAEKKLDLPSGWRTALAKGI